MLCAMIAGSALVIAVGRRRPEPARVRHAPPRPHERPWLTHEAAAQIIGPGGRLGPLFAGVDLGGPAPSPEVRARIAAFARANDVRIDLEIVDDELVAVRFDVTYGGCCGYEGADVLALRLRRPSTELCCVCGADTWIDDWYGTTEDGASFRARVRVNRLAVRWERTATLPEVFERADALLGQPTATARNAAGDRWRELEPGRRYLLEVPLPLERYADDTTVVSPRGREDNGILVLAERGRIVQVSLVLDGIDREDLRTALSARWGRLRTQTSDRWTWRTPVRAITADFDGDPVRVTIQRRGIGPRGLAL